MKRYFMGLFAVVLTLGCTGKEEETVSALVLEIQEHAIRNGTREPRVLVLTDEQKMAIGWLHPQGAPHSPFCTGTLVSPRVVATASHCIEGRGQSRIGFGVGLLPRDAEHSFVVSEAIAHPRLDAAILILEEDATAAGPAIEPIAFSRSAPDADLVGSEVEAAGYGETYDASREGRYFAVVQLNAIQATEVVVDGRGRQGICFGDSGGPVMVTGPDDVTVVLGVESWGEPSCLGVDHLTRLDVVADWIDETVAARIEIEQLSPECRAAGPDGRCDEDVLQWCEDGEVMTRDCAAEGLRCKPTENDGGNDCLEPDPCEIVGSRGACEGDTVQRCRFGELQVEDCTEEGKVCRSDAGGAFCATPSDDDDRESPNVQNGVDAEGDDDGSEGDEESDGEEGDDEASENEEDAALGGVSAEGGDEDAGGSAMVAEHGGLERSKGSGCQAVPGHGTAPLILLAPWAALIILRSRSW